MIQKILNKVLNSGYYYPEVKPQFNSFMCLAAEQAAENNVIYLSELELLNEVIDDYLGNYDNLEFALDLNGLPSEFEDRKRLYQDWENRPQLKEY